MILTGEREGQAKAQRRTGAATAGDGQGPIWYYFSHGGTGAPFIYMDNAATSWPKAPGVAEAVARSLDRAVWKPGPGDARRGRFRRQAGLRGADRGRRALPVSRTPRGSIFTPGTTASLNLVLRGTLRPGALVALSAHGAQRRHAAPARPGQGARAAVRVFRDNGAFRRIAEGEAGPPRLHFRQQRDGRGLPFCRDGAGGARTFLRTRWSQSMRRKAPGKSPSTWAPSRSISSASPRTRAFSAPPGWGCSSLAPAPRPSRSSTAAREATRSPRSSRRFSRTATRAARRTFRAIAGLLAAARYIRETGVAALAATEKAVRRNACGDGLADMPGFRVHGPREARGEALHSFHDT